MSSPIAAGRTMPPARQRHKACPSEGRGQGAAGCRRDGRFQPGRKPVAALLAGLRGDGRCSARNASGFPVAMPFSLTSSVPRRGGGGLITKRGVIAAFHLSGSASSPPEFHGDGWPSRKGMDARVRWPGTARPIASDFRSRHDDAGTPAAAGRLRLRAGTEYASHRHAASRRTATR